jgi:hypothetical protein
MEKVQILRREKDPEINALQKTLACVPVLLLKPLFHMLDFFKYTRLFAPESAE